MADPYTQIRTRNVPQTAQTDPRQAPNNAGGWTFTTDWQQQLGRFLILGTAGGTYYAGEAAHTEQATDAVAGVIAEHGLEAVSIITGVSVDGRAPKQQPAIFALALAASAADERTRRAALDALPAVCRTGTALFTFARYVEQFRGWGRGMRRAVAGWYLDPMLDQVAFQAVKYPQRDGWSHRDLLRLAHPRGDAARSELFSWIVGKPRWSEGAEPMIVAGARIAAEATKLTPVVAAIVAYKLPWEAVPSQWLNEPKVWEALLPRLPLGAMIRQLPRLTRIGMLDAYAERLTVTSHLTDALALRKARVHPLTVLNALVGYQTGRARSGGEFVPHPAIIDALDAAFYASFGSVTPVGRPVTLALDISASMDWGSIAGTNLTPRVASAALALITAATEPDYELLAYSDRMIPLTVSPRQRLDDVAKALTQLPWGSTDCALPVLDALDRRRETDLFVSYTDNETWAGRVHPHTALRAYRDGMGRPTTRMVVVGMTATEFTIADPGDPFTMDVVGFDLATPGLISEFGRGEL